MASLHRAVRDVTRDATPAEDALLDRLLVLKAQRSAIEREEKSISGTLKDGMEADDKLMTIIARNGQATLDEHRSYTLDAKRLKAEVDEAVWKPYEKSSTTRRLVVTDRAAPAVPQVGASQGSEAVA